jgi:hypothetical protein
MPLNDDRTFESAPCQVPGRLPWHGLRLSTFLFFYAYEHFFEQIALKLLPRETVLPDTKFAVKSQLAKPGPGQLLRDGHLSFIITK